MIRVGWGRWGVVSLAKLVTNTSSGNISMEQTMQVLGRRCGQVVEKLYSESESKGLPVCLSSQTVASSASHRGSYQHFSYKNSQLSRLFFFLLFLFSLSPRLKLRPNLTDYRHTQLSFTPCDACTPSTVQRSKQVLPFHVSSLHTA